MSEAIDNISRSNPIDAVTFASAVNSFPTSERYFENVFGVVDLVDVGLAGIPAAAKLSKLGKALTTQVKALGRPSADVTSILGEMGATEAATEIGAARILSSDLQNVSDSRKLDELKERSRSSLTPINSSVVTRLTTVVARCRVFFRLSIGLALLL